MYNTGEGVPKDAVLAYLWWSAAEANGHREAKKKWQKISKSMTASEIERAQELSRKCFAQDYKNCGK